MQQEKRNEKKPWKNDEVEWREREITRQFGPTDELSFKHFLAVMYRFVKRKEQQTSTQRKTVRRLKVKQNER